MKESSREKEQAERVLKSADEERRDKARSPICIHDVGTASSALLALKRLGAETCRSPSPRRASETRHSPSHHRHPKVK